MAKHFTADIQLARLLIGHDTLRGRDDRNTESGKNARSLICFAIAAQPRRRNTLESDNCRIAIAILERYAKIALLIILHSLYTFNVALFAKNFADGIFQIRRRHNDIFMPRLERITYASKKI